MWYFEAFHPLGHWSLQCSLSEPRVRSKQGQPDRIGSDIGPRVRGVTEVHPDHHRLTLDQLAQVYGRDGKFYATRPVRAADGSWTTAQSDPQRYGRQAADNANT